jgi:hypothetical protein
MKPALAALSLLALFAWASTEVSDPDTWQHLVSGRYLVERHSFPWPDPFSFTTAMVKPAYSGEEATREFNIKHELLAQILLYSAYAAGGFAGLVLLRCALLAAFCGMIGLAAWRRTQNFYRAWAAAGLTAVIAIQFRGDRPHLFTFVFLAATLAILEYRRRLWLLPPLFLLWANTHGGFFLGWVLLGMYGAEMLWSRWRGQPAPDERRFWLAALAAALLSGLNPTGFQVIPVLLAYRKSVAQTTLWEWQRPALWPPERFSILLAAAAGILLWQRRRVRARHWLLLALFGGAAFTALRNMILAAAAAPLLIVTYFPGKRRPPAVASYGLVLALAVLAMVPVAGGRAFQFRSADWKYPARAADFVLAHHLTARMFNTWEFGAYLIWRLWPQQRVFIDGRVQSETVYLDYQRMVYNVKAAAEPVNSPFQALRPRVVSGSSAEELLDRYGIEMILMDGFEYTTGSLYFLAAALADPRQTQWQLVYRDSQAMIFMRHPPAGVAPLPQWEVLDTLEAQCREHLRHEPATSGCASALSDMFARLGDRLRSRRWQAAAAEN